MIVVLALLNAILLLALLSGGGSLPRALAQAAGVRSGDYLCATARMSGQTFDVFYVLDVGDRKLFAFYPATSARRAPLVPAPPRDLASDFEGG